MHSDTLALWGLELHVHQLANIFVPFLCANHLNSIPQVLKAYYVPLISGSAFWCGSHTRRLKKLALGGFSPRIRCGRYTIHVPITPHHLG